MDETAKLTLFRRPEFSYWLITTCCCTIPLTILFAFLPVIGAHRLGIAMQDELSRYGAPAPKTDAPKPAPSVRATGIPVAYRSLGIGP